MLYRVAVHYMRVGHTKFAAVCCGVLQCEAMYCSVLQWAAVWYGVLQCCSMVRRVAVHHTHAGRASCAGCCSVLQYAAVCCSVLQRVAAFCSAPYTCGACKVCCIVLKRK